uniref:ATP synthase subunit a n=1 Tax=Philotrypesis sp. JHX-2011 TaxID=1035792 RepID=G8EEI5_9HYME|nr:ATP synthase F0 subunit 6 [Philotrypesis sp. JHX-2011]
MMMNLFSIFDPSTSMSISLNWLSMFYIFLFLPNLYWLVPSRFQYSWIKTFKHLSSEFYMLLNNKINVINCLIFISLFSLILLNNFVGMFSYIFTASSHLGFSMPLSLLLWLIFMIFGWAINMNHMFTHLVPQGTPTILMPFMVLIETISNIIRPLTLAVRLSANMIAGHLLLTLIASTGSELPMITLFVMLLSQNLLVVLELSVSIIQAYVFTVLSTLYSTETN